MYLLIPLSTGPIMTRFWPKKLRSGSNQHQKLPKKICLLRMFLKLWIMISILTPKVNSKTVTTKGNQGLRSYFKPSNSVEKFQTSNFVSFKYTFDLFISLILSTGG